MTHTLTCGGKEKLSEDWAWGEGAASREVCGRQGNSICKNLESNKDFRWFLKEMKVVCTNSLTGESVCISKRTARYGNTHL
jgi:hypothetical protein